MFITNHRNNCRSSNGNSGDLMTLAEQQFGEPQIDENGKAICGRGKSNGDICKMDSGWGTHHIGYGACKHHDSETALDLPLPKGKILYSEVATNNRLRSHLSQEEDRTELDNIDGEIVLLRAMMKILVEKYGHSVADDTGEIIDIIEFGTSFDEIESQTKAIVNLVDKISAGIKRKYEVMQIAGNTVTRERVREYLSQIQIGLSQVLRNECPKCRHQHNMRDTAVKSIKSVGEI